MTCLSVDCCFSELLMDHTDKIAELALNNNHLFTIHSPKFCKNYVKYLCKHFWGNKLLWPGYTYVNFIYRGNLYYEKKV
jgi:hypothetical protein